MMTSTNINLKARPDIAKIIRRAIPNYRKHTATLHEHVTSITPTGTYWDGGSVSSYVHVRANGSLGRVPAPTAPPQFGGGSPEPFAIPEGDAVVVAGTFRGKAAYAGVYLNN